MVKKDPKELVKAIADRVGKPEARELLCAEGIAKVTAERLIRGSYKPEVKALVRGAIERAFSAAKARRSA